MKLLPRSKIKQLTKPWITNGILKSIKRKQKMYRTHFLSNNPLKVEEYKHYANQLNYIKNRSKTDYYTKTFASYKNNLKSTWKLIGTLINRKTKGQTLPTRLIRNNKTYTNQLEVANQFNDFFVNVGPSLARQIPTIPNNNPTQFIDQSPSSSFFISPVTEYEVHQLFSSLSENKASIDIPNKLIKIASKPLSKPFTLIYNESVSTGTVPDIFKIARITPVYKSGAQTDPGNYRPIALLSPFCKILERIIYNQLISFLEKHHILFQYQFGFRKGYSTEQAILEITDSLKLGIDNKLITCGIFLDFSKAFDTVNHEILLAKLYKYGIRGTAHDWFSNYLLNRKQFVQIGNSHSSLLDISCGVPQGSTIGPLLFLLYINDMPNSAKKTLVSNIC